MSVIHQPRKPELDARVLLFPAILLVLLCVLFLRLWYFQVVRSTELTERGEVLNETSIPEIAPRGLIFDRNGVLLAGVKPEWVITAIPKLVDSDPTVLPRLAKLIGADPKRLKNKVEDGNWKPWLPTAIYIGASTEVASQIAERWDEFPGIDVKSQPMRYYPDPTSFSHLMGYVWVPSESDVKRIKAIGKEPADYVGKNGLEWRYEDSLMGVPGETRMELDAKRRPSKVIGRDAPEPGNQLVLSIDKNLQQTAMKALGDHRGAVVALDPNNGEVLCMASTPTFDLELFKHGISHADFDSLQNNPTHPFLNRPMQVKFAPGSTFKIVTAIAAMEKGIFDPNRTYFCAGGIKLGNKFIKCLGHHGSISFERAMAKSCNSYFMSLALQVDRDTMLKAAQEVGFYQKTGIDLNPVSERRGDLPTERYMAQYWPKYHWPLADTAYLGIGQGILSVTPLQMANLIALVANNGTNFTPHVVKAVRHTGDKMKIEPVIPEIAHEVKGPPVFWHELKDALAEVVEDGTARRWGHIEGIRWGGKTGSAEEKKDKLTHSWFVGFAPYDHPKIAICVFVEQGGHGGDVAVPIAKAVVQRYLAPKDAKPSSNTLRAPATSLTLEESPKAR
ncbi:MAG: penicillin-binding protein 2 [Armatimonadetes bacterium]|nr:penicillin-binding protein 2 [Armatimonadota bacterium]